MPKHDSVFVPHRACTETSGACFEMGRCLSQCQAHKRRTLEARIEALERRVLALELLAYAEAKRRAGA